eukprot:s999_g9.t1
MRLGLSLALKKIGETSEASQADTQPEALGALNCRNYEPSGLFHCLNISCRLLRYWICGEIFFLSYSQLTPFAKKHNAEKKKCCLEDGNWRCDHCGNVNFPRRQRCNKCQGIRGPAGDAIVLQYAARVYEPCH